MFIMLGIQIPSGVMTLNFLYYLNWNNKNKLSQPNP